MAVFKSNCGPMQSEHSNQELIFRQKYSVVYKYLNDPNI